MILEKYSALILTSNFSKFSVSSLGCRNRGGGHLSTTPPYSISKECEKNRATEESRYTISFWQLVFLSFQISCLTFIPSHDPVHYNNSLANLRELFENPQSFWPHSRSQTLRNFEGYPRKFSIPFAALILENPRNSRMRMRILEVLRSCLLPYKQTNKL